MTGVLQTARINTIEVIVSSDKLIKMVNFKLGNECDHELINMTRAWDKEKILSPRQDSFPSAFSFPTRFKIGE